MAVCVSIGKPLLSDYSVHELLDKEASDLVVDLALTAHVRAWKQRIGSSELSI